MSRFRFGHGEPSVSRMGLVLCSLMTVLLTSCVTASNHPFASAPSVPRAQAPPPAATHDVRWLVLSDLHFDPFAEAPAVVARLATAPVATWPRILALQGGRKISGYGHDSNGALIESALGEMRRDVPDPPVVFVAGDFLAHGFRARFLASTGDRNEDAYRAFVLKTMDYLALVLHQAYPRAQILPVIGNNDGFCEDYHSTPGDAFLAHEALTWGPLVDVNGRAPAFVKTFAAGGYYQARLPLRALRVVVPNSIFWSARYQNRCGDAAQSPGSDELTWLSAVLKHGPPGSRTWVATHIPPGVDTFKTLVHFGAPSLLWDADTQRTFLALVDDPHAGVRTILTGHLHAFWLRQSDAGRSDDIPILIAPSISPIFGNAPAFLDITVSARNAQIDDVQAYALGHLLSVDGAPPAWYRAFDFNSAFGVHGVTAPSLAALHAREPTTRWLRGSIARYAVLGGISRVVTRLNWRSSWCAEIALTRDAFIDCYAHDGR
ncbi:MAG TPA: metallophosphoesterase [Candidatus Baltobacteraceae bacterium]